MTPSQPAKPGGAGRARAYAMRLDAEQCGTMLGALTWVLGSLAILRDRGHASGEESLHELADALEPKLESLVLELGGTRAAAGINPEREAVVDAAYASVREAFEAWVSVTASDTIAAALEHRLAQAGDATSDAGDGPGTAG
jgi:hypothetical protein